MLPRGDSKCKSGHQAQVQVFVTGDTASSKGKEKKCNVESWSFSRAKLRARALLSLVCRSV